MSKIQNVRLPNAVSGDYSPEQFNQLVRSLEQVILQLNSTYTPIVSQDTAGAATWMSAGSGAGGGFAGGVRGFQLSNGMLQPHAMLLSDVDQESDGITSENLLTYNVVALTNGIRVVDNTKIFVPCSGQYLVTFTLQMTNRSNSAAEFEIWAKDTGVNYPLSNTRFDIPARKSGSIWAHVVPAVTGIFTVTDPAVNYLEIAWWSDNADVYIEHYAAGVSPTRPAIPSVILTINFVSAG
jgi:limonene-1,2-epoxide hydrolase